MTSTPRRATTARAAPPASGSLAVALVVTLALLAAAPLWGPGIVNTRGGGDSPFLIQRTMDLADSFRHGIFPPRWMAHAAYDLGYPFFNHYAALPYYISATLTAIGINPLSAIQATQTLGFLLAALAMYAWSGRIFRGRAARVIAVAAYTFAPFHLVNVYVRGDSLSEFYAFVWYPFILWALDRVARRPTVRNTTAAAVAYGALILTHNVSALIFSPFALLYGLIAVHAWHSRAPDRSPPPGDPLGPTSAGSRGPASGGPFGPASAGSQGAASRRARPRYPDTGTGIGRQHRLRAPDPTPLLRLAAIAGTFLIGVLLTTWFWLPAIAEAKYGQMGPEFTEGYFHYSNHFRGTDLIQSTLAFDYSVATDVEAAGPFSMGLVQAGLALVGAGILIAVSSRAKCQQDHRAIALGLVLMLALATLMITPLSRPLWDRIPLLALTQFPWRFLSVQALLTAIITGALGERGLWPGGHNPDISMRQKVISALTLSLWLIPIAGAALTDLDPAKLMISTEDITWENLRRYESFTGNIGTTIRYEYLPQDVVPRLYTAEAVIDGAGSVIADSAQIIEAELVARTPVRRDWRVTLDSGPDAVSFPLNWWPGWQATIDGESVTCGPTPGSGRLSVVLPEGSHRVSLHLHATPLRRIASAISLLGIIAVVTAVSRDATTRRRWRGAAIDMARGAVLLALALVGPLALQRPPLKEAVFFDFDAMPFPHQGPVSFGEATLTAVSMPEDDAAPGDSMPITLTWAGEPALPAKVTAQLVSPALPRHGVDYILAAATRSVASETEITLDLPADLARGQYLVRLLVHDQLGMVTPETPSGHTMGDLYVGHVIAPIGPPNAPDAPVLGEFRDLTLHTVETHQTTATRLTVKMGWSTPGTPRNWRLSLRILEGTGRLVVQQDHQPGYGYLPTTLWRAGERVVDYAYLALPEGLAPGDYTLQVITYLQATSEGGGQVEVPLMLDTPTLYDLRDACCEQTRKGATILCQSGEIALLGLDHPVAITEGDDLAVVAEWNALLAPTEDLGARWTLRSSDGTGVAGADGPLAPGSHTSRWPRLTWVLAQTPLDLPNTLSAGTYDLQLDLRSGGIDVVRCGTVSTVEIRARPRTFEVPSVPHAQEANFAGTLRLLGYDLVRREQHLKVTLWWQATATPVRDLKRFVHLYDPASHEIISQDDAIPRNWTYPTTWWLPGEVVSETVSLDLAGAQPGTYALGVGWYDPATLDRLPVTPPTVGGAANDRVDLLETVTVR